MTQFLVAGEGGVAHSTPTNQKPSNAPIFVHSSAGHAAAVAAATAAAAKLFPHDAGVATKTPAVTAMAGAQTTITNQLKAVAARAMEMATMRATTHFKIRVLGTYLRYLLTNPTSRHCDSDLDIQSHFLSHDITFESCQNHFLG
jgi:hypothetical protein